MPRPATDTSASRPAGERPFLAEGIARALSGDRKGARAPLERARALAPALAPRIDPLLKDLGRTGD